MFFSDLALYYSYSASLYDASRNATMHDSALLVVALFAAHSYVVEVLACLDYAPLDKKTHILMKKKLANLKWSKLTRACAKLVAHNHIDAQVRTRVAAYILEQDAEALVEHVA